MRSPHWSLIQYRRSESDSTHLGVLFEDAVHALPASWPENAAQLLDEWRQWEAKLRNLDVHSLQTLSETELIAPLTYPRKIVCAGANYSDHVQEMGGTVPSVPSEPFFFLKPPSTTIVGTGSDILFPEGEGVKLDFEAELGVVIADRCQGIDAAHAMEHVAGYVVANDVSARGLFHRGDPMAPAFAWDWFAHKAFDGSCPIGPGIVPAWLVGEPQNLRITLAVNGQTKQDSSTSNLIAGIPELIAAASRHMTLEPGDLILTGTPAGVGMPRGEFLAPGDVISVEIEGLGRLENRVSLRNRSLAQL
ncbi:FAA hydrolase family protein [Paenarthrobacter ureafaciens]|uniref:fumarylacetoacetate hydrolase family protein n=1 Tax=Paenarthrobacter ureafaciens TaxID=37931 RepID=UPI0015BAA457|nr:fumarylacetoacetate hydrolase family protein [Paenarthrobacter ureafaciens]NWL26728.1 FAA hydrolase family protein [Paenarthrobacter ureafaciens]